jgi:hypothetical protein
VSSGGYFSCLMSTITILDNSILQFCMHLLVAASAKEYKACTKALSCVVKSSTSCSLERSKTRPGSSFSTPR